MLRLSLFSRIFLALFFFATTSVCQSVAGEHGDQTSETGVATATKSLIEKVQESEKKLLKKALELAESGRDSSRLVEILTKQLESDNPRVRALAARALGLIGEPAKPAAKALAKLIADQDEKVRRVAIQALTRIKPGADMVVPLMQEALQHADPYVVAFATHSLAEVGPTIVPAMIKAMEDDSTIYYAILVLTELGPDAKAAVPAVSEALAHKNAEVRHEAAQALRAIGPDAQAAIPQLTKALEDEYVQMPAALALGSIGSPASSALPALEKISEDSDDVSEICALWAIAKIESDHEKTKTVTVPALAGFLVSDDQQVRRAAAMALLDLKPGPKVIAPLIAELFADASEEAKADMIDAVSTLGAEAVPRLIEALNFSEIRQQAVTILGQIGPDAESAIPALLAYAEDEDAELRADLFMTLGHIGSNNKDVIAASIKALDDKDEEVVISALYALGKSGTHATACAAKVKQLLDGGNARYETICAWALVKVEPENQQYQQAAIPLLMKALDHQEDAVRNEAITTLGAIGTAAEAAVAKLTEMAASDSNPEIRKSANEAVKLIGK